MGGGNGVSDVDVPCSDRLSFYHLNQKITDTIIAKTCLAYLLQFIQHGGVNSSTKKFYPLSYYAAQHFMKHARPDDGDSDAPHRPIMDLDRPHDDMYTNGLMLYKRGPLTLSTSRLRCAPLYHTSFVEKSELMSLGEVLTPWHLRRLCMKRPHGVCILSILVLNLVPAAAR